MWGFRAEGLGFRGFGVEGLGLRVEGPMNQATESPRTRQKTLKKSLE